ncbi:hypothetical protein G9A89_009872 [Geosiphon pyriformis]|nr:hypothetical protein G9A89_009872 [Geosiphon pyriformis]
MNINPLPIGFSKSKFDNLAMSRLTEAVNILQNSPSINKLPPVAEKGNDEKIFEMVECKIEGTQVSSAILYRENEVDSRQTLAQNDGQFCADVNFNQLVKADNSTTLGTKSSVHHLNLCLEPKIQLIPDMEAKKETPAPISSKRHSNSSKLITVSHSVQRAYRTREKRRASLTMNYHHKYNDSSGSETRKSQRTRDNGPKEASNIFADFKECLEYRRKVGTGVQKLIAAELTQLGKSFGIEFSQTDISSMARGLAPARHKIDLVNAWIAAEQEKRAKEEI